MQLEYTIPEPMPPRTAYPRYACQMLVDVASSPYPMMPQTMPPMIVAQRTLRSPLLRRQACERLDERFEDDEEGERPEGLGDTPVMRRLERAGHRAPGVLEQAGQHHGYPGRVIGTQRPQPRMSLGVSPTRNFRPVAVGYFLKGGITGYCGHWSPPIPFVRGGDDSSSGAHGCRAEYAAGQFHRDDWNVRLKRVSVPAGQVGSPGSAWASGQGATHGHPRPGTAGRGAVHPAGRGPARAGRQTAP